MLSRLYTPLLVLLVVWSSCVVFGLIGVSVCALIFICAMVLSGWWRASALIVLLVVAVLFALLMPAVQSAREASSRAQCMNNLNNIALALLSYKDQYGCLPPACIADKNGKPMHSWRVLILPYLERKDMYEQYDFNEPWDGPNNKKLLTHRPRVYTCPADTAAREQVATTTSYVAVVGVNAAWHQNEASKLNEPKLRGHEAETILLIETADSGIQWTEPKDLSLDNNEPAAFSPDELRIQGPHMRSNGFFYYDTPSGANVAFWDGHMQFLPTCNLTPDKLRSLLTVGGFKDYNAVSSYRNQELKINWFNCFALAVWLLSVSLLLLQAVRSRKPRQTEVVENAAS